MYGPGHTPFLDWSMRSSGRKSWSSLQLEGGWGIDGGGGGGGHTSC